MSNTTEPCDTGAITMRAYREVPLIRFFLETPQTMSPFIFRLLGPLAVESRGTPVEFKRIKARALAAYLACNPQLHTRSHLVSLL
jgi:hypothetical protein